MNHFNPAKPLQMLKQTNFSNMAAAQPKYQERTFQLFKLRSDIFQKILEILKNNAPPPIFLTKC